jgi:hypothetical protein
LGFSKRDFESSGSRSQMGQALEGLAEANARCTIKWRGKKMASSGNVRRNLLMVGGALSIVGGISQAVSGGLIIVDFVVSYLHNWRLIYTLVLPGLPDAWRHYILWGGGPILMSMSYVPIRWAIVGGCLGALGIVAVVGGVSAIRGKRFGLSLAGAICALPSVFVGIAAVILVVLGRREFGAKG